MTEPFIATGYIRVLYRFARAEGASPDQLLKETGCTESDLMKADFDMPFDAQMRLCQNAIEASNSGLGLRAGHQLQLAAHGALGTAIQTAPDLGTGIQTFVDLIASRANFFELGSESTRRGTQLTISVRSLPDQLVPFFTENILLTISHCFAFYSGQHDNIKALNLSYPEPSYHEDYRTNFGTDVSFDSASTALLFDRSLLDLPSPESDPLIHKESIERCRINLDQRNKQESVVSNLEHFLLDNPGKLWTVDEISPLFAISSRTLIRQLRDEGTTYQALRDNILKKQAAQYLRQMSVEATAMSLGFSDTSSFRRTFKRWFGATPSTYQAP